MSTFDGGRRWADHLFGLPNTQWEQCVGMPFSIWLSILFRPLVWILVTKAVRTWLVVCTMVRLLRSSYRIALPEKQSSPSFIHQKHASFMAGGPEVHVTVTEIPNQVSCVVFGPFHLTDFKEKCIMLCLEGEKKQHWTPSSPAALMDRSLQGRKWSLSELIYLAQGHPHRSGSQDNALDHDPPDQCEDHPFQPTKSQGNVLTFFC